VDVDGGWDDARGAANMEDKSAEVDVTMLGLGAGVKIQQLVISGAGASAVVGEVSGVWGVGHGLLGSETCVLLSSKRAEEFRRENLVVCGYNTQQLHPYQRRRRHRARTPLVSLHSR